MMNSWIDDFEDIDEGVATMERDYNDRDCTFCDKMAVCVIRFGSMSVHLCEVHTEPQETK